MPLKISAENAVADHDSKLRNERHAFSSGHPFDIYY